MVGEDKTKFRERKEEILERSILHSYILNIIKLKKKKKILHLFFHRNTKFSRTNDFPLFVEEKRREKREREKEKKCPFLPFQIPTPPTSRTRASTHGETETGRGVAGIARRWMTRGVHAPTS